MKKFFKQIKSEFFYWRKCIFQYHQFWHYIYNKYILAPKILKIDKVLEKPVNQTDLSIHILTCHRDLIMAMWSLASFYLNSSVVGQLYIHNDGSLTEKDKMYLRKFFFSAKIIEPQDVENNYNKLVDYEIIKDIRINKVKKYFLLKKLLDPFIISNKNQVLVIDSDLLWFAQPIEIEQEINNKCSKSLITTNNIQTFIYFKNGKNISKELATCNSGIVLYKKENFNLEKLTEYFNNFDYHNFKNKHFIEQAGYAYALDNLVKLPTDKYTIQNEFSDDIIVKHYTSPRRPLFYIEGINKLKDKIF